MEKNIDLERFSYDYEVFCELHRPEEGAGLFVGLWCKLDTANGNGRFTPRKELYLAYKRFCQRFGLKRMHRDWFFEYLVKIFPNLKLARNFRGTARCDIVEGIEPKRGRLDTVIIQRCILPYLVDKDSDKRGYILGDETCIDASHESLDVLFDRYVDTYYLLMINAVTNLPIAVESLPLKLFREILKNENYRIEKRKVDLITKTFDGRQKFEFDVVTDCVTGIKFADGRKIEKFYKISAPYFTQLHDSWTDWKDLDVDEGSYVKTENGWHKPWDAAS